MGKMKELYQELKENNNLDETDKHYNEEQHLQDWFDNHVIVDADDEELANTIKDKLKQGLIKEK